jgi:Porin subfamily
VKAKPVEYVKVCSLYGSGFWYVPGTDTCLKIGGFVRVQTTYNATTSNAPIGGGNNDPGGRETRTDTSNFGFRTRSDLSIDLRTQTEYGTLRSYMDVGAQWSTNNGTADNNPSVADTLYVSRGFIQFAGFTAGRIRSYFDVNSLLAYTYSVVRISGDTAHTDGIYGIGYTAQFGNGVTATVSIEDNGQTVNGRGHLVSNLNMPEFGLGATSFDNKGQQAPDVVGNLRIEQAWGYAQVAAALHDASGGYYTTAASIGCGAGVNCVTGGHPADKYGFAVTGGFTLNDVLGFKGDQVGAEAVYAEGAAGYVTRGLGAWQMYSSGNNAGFGWLTDSVYASGSNIELTTVWGVNGFAQHLWNPKWRTSVYGGYVEVDYNSNAKTLICPAGTATATPVGFVAGALTGVSNCNPDFSFWQVGTRTQWNPHPDLDVGVDVQWTHLNTAYKGSATLAANGARPTGVYAIDDQDIVTVMFRIQRNFLP